MKKMLVGLLLLLLASGTAFSQSWNAAITTGLTAVGYTQVGNVYTITLYNMTGIPGDTTEGYDMLVWSLQAFNMPAPETMLSMPDEWKWRDGKWTLFAVEQNNRKYYTPPSLAPGQSLTISYTSSLATSANNGGPADGSAGFMAHVAAVDSSIPGSDTLRWTPYQSSDLPSSWFDHSTIVTELPEPGSMIVLTGGLAGAAGYVIRRRRRHS